MFADVCINIMCIFAQLRIFTHVCSRLRILCECLRKDAYVYQSVYEWGISICMHKFAQVKLF